MSTKKSDHKQVDLSNADQSPGLFDARKTFKRGRALALPTLSVKNMKEGDSIFVKLLEAPIPQL